MKITTILVAALSSLAFSAAAQTSLVVEYDYFNQAQSKNKSHYGAIGVAQSTQYGVFDAYAQASRSKGAITDNINGYEFGYTKPLSYGKVNFMPRIAVGDMTDIEVSPTKNIEAFYVLGSVEANTMVSEKVGVFAAVSQMRGLNNDAIQVSNRVNVGVDYFVNSNNAVRLGYSFVRQLQYNQSGAQLIYSYTF